MEWSITIAVAVVFGGLAAFAGWKSGRPQKDLLRARWVSWPLVTIFSATAAIFAVIHILGMMGVSTGANVTSAYSR